MRTIKVGDPLSLDDGPKPPTICIDRIILNDGVQLLAGWTHACEISSFSCKDEPSRSEQRQFSRNDVAAGFGFDESQVRGFLLLWTGGSPESINLHLKVGKSFSECSVSRLGATQLDGAVAKDLARDYRDYLGLINNYFQESVCWGHALAQVASQLPPSPESKGHLELARGVQDIGGLIIGWSISGSSSNLTILSESGHQVCLDRAARWNRDDIVATFSDEYGNQSQFAGFLTSQHKPISYGEKAFLVCSESDQMHLLGSCEWSQAPKDPLSFARWAFDYNTPMSKFHSRLNEHDGPLIGKLIERHRLNAELRSSKVVEYGEQIQTPVCSLVIPLYRRLDFMKNQLLELSDDDYIRRNCEIVYVLDDPPLDDALRSLAPILQESYGIPFKIMYSEINRGFAGATNLGTREARAPLLLLMNSDVIPVETGWLERMIEQINASPDIGAVGTRLLYANGAIQHDGMRFTWEPSWNCHLNKHPNTGMDPVTLNVRPVTEEIAVTAACVLVRSADFAAIGKLDDQFLIGDFEDSDLCLKFLNRGDRILCVHSNNLVHLERQSFSSLGSSAFRDKVARYNAWRHEHRWKETILNETMKRR